MTELKKTFLPLPQEAIDEDAIKVVRRLKAQGHTAYLVGGGVRDLLLSLTPKDFDVATSARPEEVRNTFRNCRLIGKRFRLAHVHFREGKVIEVSTFRRIPQDLDTEDLMIRDDNAFGSEAEDAARRDFTINALFYDVESQTVIDYVGGVEDLRAKRIRTIGTPTLRFREDPVRILRGIKFAARLQMDLDPELIEAASLVAPDILRCSPPRILEELLRMLRGGHAESSFRLLSSLGVLDVIMPDISRLLERYQEKTHLRPLTNGATTLSDAEHLIHFLQHVDLLTKEAGSLPDSVLLAALYWVPLERADKSAREHGRRVDPQVLIRQVAGATLDRLSVPRKVRDRLVRILAAQNRLQQRRRGKNTRPEIFARRDFFSDAVILLTLRAKAFHDERLLEQSNFWTRYLSDPRRAAQEDAKQGSDQQAAPQEKNQKRTRRGRRGGRNQRGNQKAGEPRQYTNGQPTHTNGTPQIEERPLAVPVQHTGEIEER